MNPFFYNTTIYFLFLNHCIDAHSTMEPERFFHYEDTYTNLVDNEHALQIGAIGMYGKRNGLLITTDWQVWDFELRRGGDGVVLLNRPEAMAERYLPLFKDATFRKHRKHIDRLFMVRTLLETVAFTHVQLNLMFTFRKDNGRMEEFGLTMVVERDMSSVLFIENGGQSKQKLLEQVDLCDEGETFDWWVGVRVDSIVYVSGFKNREYWVVVNGRRLIKRSLGEDMARQEDGSCSLLKIDICLEREGKDVVEGKEAENKNFKIQLITGERKGSRCPVPVNWYVVSGYQQDDDRIVLMVLKGPKRVDNVSDGNVTGNGSSETSTWGSGGSSLKQVYTIRISMLDLGPFEVEVQSYEQFFRENKNSFCQDCKSFFRISSRD